MIINNIVILMTVIVTCLELIRIIMKSIGILMTLNVTCLQNPTLVFPNSFTSISWVFSPWLMRMRIFVFNSSLTTGTKEWPSQLTCGFLLQYSVLGGWNRGHQAKFRPKLVRASSLRLLDQNLLFVDVGEKDISATSENCPGKRKCFRLGFAHIAIITQVKTDNRLSSCYKRTIG